MNIARHRMKKPICQILAAVLLVPLLYLLWLLAHVFFFDVFIIPTDSMQPTLQPGDRVLVNKLVLGPRLYHSIFLKNEVQQLHSTRLKGLRHVRRGDVVVFNNPQHNGHISFLINHVYAKRCVALPGDSLSVINGYFVNNNWQHPLGIRAEQQRLRVTADSLFSAETYNVAPYDEHVGWTIKNLGPFYVPRKGDVVRITPLTASYLRLPIEWELGEKLNINWEHGEVYTAHGQTLSTHTFRHDYYYMCGDNVCDSNDSRYWGVVPEEYIIGIASYVLYGRDKQTGNLRHHRILKSL